MPTGQQPQASEKHATGSKGRMIRNVMSNWGAYFLAMAINFALSPYVVHHLGNTGYGVWTLVLSLTGYLGLLDLGVRGAVTRYIAKFHTQSDHERASNVASSAMLIFSGAGLIAILFATVAAAAVIDRMAIPAQYLTAARIVLIIIGLNIAVSLVNGVFGGILVGLQRFDLTNGIEIGINILRAAVIVTALYLGRGIVTLALIQLGFTVARLAMNVSLVHRLYPELKIRFADADQSGIKSIFSFSAFSFLLHVSASLIYASDNVVIGAYLPVSAVTFYVIGGNLVEYARSMVGGISQTMTPLASSTDAKKNQLELQSVVLLSSQAGSMVVLPVATTFMLRGSTFIGLWMGSQFEELSGKVLWILSLTLIFWAANSVTAGSILGLGKHKPLVPVLLAEGVFNLILSIFLVQRIGIVGVAWGTVIPSICSGLLFWPWYVRRTIGIQVFNYIASSWLRPGLGILPYALATYAIERFWLPNHLTGFFLQVAIVLPLAAVGYWLTCFDAERRMKYYRGVSQSFVRVFAGRQEIINRPEE